MSLRSLLPFLGNDEDLRRILIMIGYMIIIAGFAVAAVLLWPVLRWVVGLLSPFLAALIVAYLFNPVVNYFQYRLRINRIYGVVVVNLIVLLLAVIAIAIIIPILISQARSATNEIRDLMRMRAAPWVVDQIGAREAPSADLALSVAESLPAWFGTEDEFSADSVIRRVLALSEVEEEEARVPAKDARLLAEAIRNWFDEPWEGGLEREDLQEWLGSQSEGWRDLEATRRLADRVEDWITARDLTVESIIESALASADFRSAAQSAAVEGAGVIGWVVTSILASVVWLVTSVIFLVFVILLSFYLLVDFASLRGAMEVICPSKLRPRCFDLLRKMDVAVGGFIRGQMLVAFIVGVLTAVGLFFLGMKEYAVLIGVLAGVANLVPFFGPVIGGIPAVSYVLLSESYSDERLLFVGLTVGWFVLIQTLESLVLQPYIVGQSARLHPVTVIMAVAIGAQFGLMGALLALPITCIARVLLKEFFWDERFANWREETGKRRLDDHPRHRKSRGYVMK